MIHAELELLTTERVQGCIIAIASKGHAETQLGDETARSVCAAVSALEQQFFHALRELAPLGQTPECEMKAGAFAFRVPKQVEVTALSAHTVTVWHTLSQALLIGYKLIALSHNKHFKLSWKQQQFLSASNSAA